ncbi:MAG: nucleotidyltransferase domain-containing protein [Ignavibacteriaceae bacterium]|nr:nucleotidyltransferase domain-containing protein [Ignavibacteriaceae bacterium]
MLFGLSEETINKINTVFNEYSSVEKVIIYGSRVKGTNKNGSDIDLTLYGTNLSLHVQQKIEIELDDLMLPYKIDLSIYTKIKNYDLKEHIDRIGKIFYQKKAE